MKASKKAKFCIFDAVEAAFLERIAASEVEPYCAMAGDALLFNDRSVFDALLSKYTELAEELGVFNA